MPVASKKARRLSRRAGAGRPARGRRRGSRKAVRKGASRVGQSAASKQASRARGGGGKTVGLSVRLSIRARGPVDRDEKQVELTGLIRRRAAGAKKAAASLQDREEAARRVGRGAQPDKLARLLAALGHQQRIRILLKLLGGEATHRLLTKATGLKAGPLYHHLRELRSAGLIGPKVRDLYVLTAKGRRAILATLAVERICR